jgi:hypothetical protein
MALLKNVYRSSTWVLGDGKSLNEMEYQDPLICVFGILVEPEHHENSNH